MRALVATELLKLSLTRATWGFAAAAVVLATVRMAMVVLSAGTVSGVAKGTQTATLTMIGAASIGTVVLLIFGATAVAGEFRHATITATFLATPDRRAVIVAKLAAYAMAGVLLSVAMIVLGLGAGMALGVSGPLGWYLYYPVFSVIGAVFLSWLGVCVGLLVRNQAVAFVLPLIWLLVVEPLTRSFGLGGLTIWLPGTLTGELGPGGPPGTLPPWVAALTLTLYCLTMVVLGIRRLQHTDIA